MSPRRASGDGWRWSRVGFELLPRRRRGAALAWSGLAALTLCIGLAAGHAQWGDAAVSQPSLDAALHDAQQLQQRLEQARLSLRVSEARSQELERQIDALNQRLHDSQEELTFFRKTRDGKR